MALVLFQIKSIKPNINMYVNILSIMIEEMKDFFELETQFKDIKYWKYYK